MRVREMRLGNPLAAAGVLSFLWVGHAYATVVSGAVTGGTAFTAGGTFVKLTPPLANPFGPPDSVGNDTFQLPNLYAFDEDQNIVLPSALPVDVGSGPLPAGLTVASHYIFFDPGPTQSVVGTVDFDADVLAIATSTTNLANSDFLANTGVTYLNPDQRGLEAGDSVTISGPRQILFQVVASSPGDYVRVLTAASPVPEPDTAVLVVLGFAALAALAGPRKGPRHRLPRCRLGHRQGRPGRLDCLAGEDLLRGSPDLEASSPRGFQGHPTKVRRPALQHPALAALDPAGLALGTALGQVAAACA